MAYLTNLHDVCRSSGLKVVEVSGWQSRGHGSMSDLRTVVCHHTAGSSSGDYPSMGTVRDGRPGLPGPLSQLGLGRSGTVYVIAAGLSYHAGTVLRDDYSNSHAIGIEAESTGYGSWTDEQRDAYPRLCAALCRGYNIPASRVLAHREVCSPPGRKPDPTGIDMPGLRAAVVKLIANPGSTPQEEDELMSDAQYAAVMKKLDAIAGNFGVGPGQTTSSGTQAANLRQSQTNFNTMRAGFASLGADIVEVEAEVKLNADALKAVVTAALTGSLPDGTDVDVEQLADAVVAEMGSRLTA